jgi:hypothetical protein
VADVAVLAAEAEMAVVEGIEAALVAAVAVGIVVVGAVAEAAVVAKGDK